MGKEIELIKRWEEFADKNSLFKLNPDKERVLMLAKGVIHNIEKYSLGYCPCRMTTGNKEEDLKLVCPCNFQTQKTWREKGECWCSLFVKKQN